MDETDNFCPHCRTRLRFSRHYQAPYCPKCDQWSIPGVCKCTLCHNRPELPSQVNDHTTNPPAWNRR